MKARVPDLGHQLIRLPLTIWWKYHHSSLGSARLPAGSADAARQYSFRRTDSSRQGVKCFLASTALEARQLQFLASVSKTLFAIRRCPRLLAWTPSGSIVQGAIPSASNTSA